MFSILCLKLLKVPGVKEFGQVNILKAQLTEIIEKVVNDPSIFDTTKSIEEDELNNEILLINSIKWIMNVNNNLNKENNIVVENLKQVIIKNYIYKLISKISFKKEFLCFEEFINSHMEHS